MALTERKRKFAEALLRGERKTDAARQAGYSAATASPAAAGDSKSLAETSTKSAVLASRRINQPLFLCGAG